jgi:hypothetical protein
MNPRTVPRIILPRPRPVNKDRGEVADSGHSCLGVDAEPDPAFQAEPATVATNPPPADGEQR